MVYRGFSIAGFGGVCVAVVLAALCLSQGEAKAASPLECGMVQMGVRTHIQCTVLRERLQVKEVHLNNGACRTMQEHYELDPQAFGRLKSTVGYPVNTLDYRHVYRNGQTFYVYVMPCRLREFMVDTDQGTWGWTAQLQ